MLGPSPECAGGVVQAGLVKRLAHSHYSSQEATAMRTRLARLAALTRRGCSRDGDGRLFGPGRGGVRGVQPLHLGGEAQPGPRESALSLVVIGDSIPYNDTGDCPGCTGFVDRYADALAKATGREVETSNLSQHNGLTLPMLMDELETSFKEPLTRRGRDHRGHRPQQFRAQRRRAVRHHVRRGNVHPQGLVKGDRPMCRLLRGRVPALSTTSCSPRSRPGATADQPSCERSTSTTTGTAGRTRT